MPGRTVQEYAEVDTPGYMSFDPTGVLYVGNNNNFGNVSIHRVDLGGAVVQDYGPTFRDPDAVLFDASGSIAGTPGAVLVGGDSGGGAGYIVAILPDQSVTLPFGTPTSNMRNPSVMKFDRDGRLLITDPRSATFGYVLVSTGDFPTPLYNYGGPYPGLAIDRDNRIYTLDATGMTFQIHDSAGTLVDGAFATHTSTITELAFSALGSIWGGDLYAVSGASGELLRIDATGAITVIGTGFDDAGGLTFGPHDQLMYVSSVSGNTIYQVGPAETTVDIDVRPGDDINAVNPSLGMIPVAILTTSEADGDAADFDALQVDPATARLGPNGAAVGISSRNATAIDVDNDGDVDLRLRFRARDTGIACEDEAVVLVGETYAGEAFVGQEAIRPVLCL